MKKSCRCYVSFWNFGILVTKLCRMILSTLFRPSQASTGIFQSPEKLQSDATGWRDQGRCVCSFHHKSAQPKNVSKVISAVWNNLESGRWRWPWVSGGQLWENCVGTVEREIAWSSRSLYSPIKIPLLWHICFHFFLQFFVYFPTKLVSSCGKFTSLGLDSIDMIQPDTVCGTPAWYLSSTMARQLLCGISIFKSKATGVVASAQMVWSLVMWRARVNMQRAMHYSPTEHRSHPHFLHPPNTRSPNNSRYFFKNRHFFGMLRKAIL